MKISRPVFHFLHSTPESVGQMIQAHCQLADVPLLDLAMLSCIVQEEPKCEDFFKRFSMMVYDGHVNFFSDIWVPLPDFQREHFDRALDKMLADRLVHITTVGPVVETSRDTLYFYMHPPSTPGRFQLTTEGANLWLPFEKGVLPHFTLQSLDLLDHRLITVLNRPFGECPFNNECSLYCDNSDVKGKAACWGQIVYQWKPAAWRDVQCGYMTVCLAGYDPIKMGDPLSVTSLSLNTLEQWYELVGEVDT